MRPRPRAGALLAGWLDKEVIDLSFGEATAYPVQLLNKDDVAEAVFQDGAEFTGGELFGSQSTPSAPVPARDGEDVVQDMFTSSRPLVTSTLERRLSCALRAEDERPGSSAELGSTSPMIPLVTGMLVAEAACDGSRLLDPAELLVHENYHLMARAFNHNEPQTRIDASYPRIAFKNMQPGHHPLDKTGLEYVDSREAPSDGGSPPPLSLPPADYMVPEVHRALCAFGASTSADQVVTMGDLVRHVPRKDDTYFSFDRMLPFASAENNARTAAHFPDFVNPSDPRSPWELPGARAAAASVVRRAFAMAGLPAPPTA